MSSAVVNATETLASRPRVGLLASPAARTFLFGLVLALLTVAAYYPVHGNPFVNFDDHDYVTENQHVLKGLNLEHDQVGVHYVPCRQLASPDVALACP